MQEEIHPHTHDIMITGIRMRIKQKCVLIAAITLIPSLLYVLSVTLTLGNCRHISYAKTAEESLMSVMKSVTSAV